MTWRLDPDEAPYVPRMLRHPGFTSDDLEEILAALPNMLCSKDAEDRSHADNLWNSIVVALAGDMVEEKHRRLRAFETLVDDCWE